ncbi:hypothetical protein U27_02479 [Candidatus Vecturithrix granuli]|uniref:N-acetyltransferase domain-containing protein n=1 Tax=Vecturithrix granuli TaxID=1499967 RepID=A0A0S6W7G6_VECG1|nr:hypothetical protein U27_02479 [Candidatus Vecturithrix granuli]
MAVEIKIVEQRQDLKCYIRFPFELYKHDPYWVPPLFADEYTYYNPKTNINLRINPYQLFLAYKDRRLVGRIMALIHQEGNTLRNEKLIRWTFLDAIDDGEVVQALLQAAEAWGQVHGMEFAVGPRGFSDQEPEGALIEGFDERALINAHYNRPYLLTYLEQAGYRKDVDWVCYRMNVPDELPSTYQAIYKRLLKQQRFTCHNFTRKAELRQYILPVLELWNEAYKDLYGVSPIHDEEFQALAKKYLPILNPRFIHVIKEGNSLIGFSIVMPDITEALQKARGRLFPFGLFYLLKALKTSKTLQFLLVGVKEQYRRQGLFVLFAMALLKEVQAAGMTRVQSHLQLEDNSNINTWLERLGGTIFRRYRAFIKKL